MVGEPRLWADIDRTWLQDYLEEHDLASEFDLDDELIGSQVSWILSSEEWASLRDAWKKERQLTSTVGHDAVQAPVAEEQPTATEALLESADSVPTEEGVQAVENAGESAILEVDVVATEPDKQPDEERRIHDLTQKALSDWGAFKELFRSSPETGGVGAWETLAESPIALLQLAEKLIRMQEAEAKGKKEQTDRELEDDVNRAQNIIAGYYSYCRKRRTVPSMEHLLVFIPVLRTGHSPEAVKEAWRREAERRKQE